MSDVLVTRVFAAVLALTLIAALIIWRLVLNSQNQRLRALTSRVVVGWGFIVLIAAVLIGLYRLFGVAS